MAVDTLLCADLQEIQSGSPAACFELNVGLTNRELLLFQQATVATEDTDGACFLRIAHAADAVVCRVVIYLKKRFVALRISHACRTQDMNVGGANKTIKSSGVIRIQFGGVVAGVGELNSRLGTRVAGAVEVGDSIW